MASSLTPSGNDPRLDGPAAWYVDGDRQTGTRKSSGAVSGDQRRPAIRLKGKIVKGDPGEPLNSIVHKIPDGAEVFPYDVGYLNDKDEFQPLEAAQTRSDSLIRQVLEASPKQDSDQVIKKGGAKKAKGGVGSPRIDLESKIAKGGGSGAVLRPDPNFQVPEPPKGFPAKTAADKSGSTQFQVMHPDQIKQAQGK